MPPQQLYMQSFDKITTGGSMFEGPNLRLETTTSFSEGKGSTIACILWERKKANVFMNSLIREVFYPRVDISLLLGKISSKDTTTVTLEILLKHFLFKSNEEIINFLSRYASQNLVGFIMKEKVVNPKELCSVLAWLERNYATKYGQFTLNAFFDPEEGFQFLEINFPQGSWDEWKILAKEIKEEMKNSGMQDIASKVAIVCLEALQGPQH